MKLTRQGNLFVLSGPSGVGKGTVLDELLNEIDDIRYSISATTRPPRPGERDGIDYFFLSEDLFQKKVETGDFLEWAEVHGNYYGTPRDFVLNSLKKGEDVILEIDIQGAEQVKRAYPEGIFIFLVPPSWKALEKRIYGRGTEDSKNIGLRLKNAQIEFRKIVNYDYVVVNDEVQNAVKKIKAIISAERCRVSKLDIEQLLKKL